MTDFAELAIASLEAGNDMEATLRALRAEGATASDCITAVQAIGLTGSDAKRLVATSDAWADLFSLARQHRQTGE